MYLMLSCILLLLLLFTFSHKFKTGHLFAFLLCGIKFIFFWNDLLFLSSIFFTIFHFRYILFT